MSDHTYYYADTNEPTELCTGLPSKGQMLPHVAKWQAEIEREVQDKNGRERPSSVTQRLTYNGRTRTK